MGIIYAFCGWVDLSDHSQAVRPGLLGRKRVGDQCLLCCLFCWYALLQGGGNDAHDDCARPTTAPTPFKALPRRGPTGPSLTLLWGKSLCFPDVESAAREWGPRRHWALPQWWPCDAPAQEWGCILRGVPKRAYAASGGCVMVPNLRLSQYKKTMPLGSRMSCERHVVALPLPLSISMVIICVPQSC